MMQRMKMRYINILLIGAIALSGLSCTKEGPVPAPVNDRDIKEFYGGFESEETGTKVYLDENVRIHWDSEDQVSIFNFNTANVPYVFQGSTGDRSGTFKRDTQFGGSTTGDVTNMVYAVYPYRASTSVTASGALSVEMPGTQAYRVSSFGRDANTMVCASDDNALVFKNACGFLVLKVYGTGEVHSIKLKSGNGVRISGNSTVTFNDGTPTVSVNANGSDEILLNCATPVTLNASSSEAVEFWFVVPPVALNNGFTATVYGPGTSSNQQTTTKAFTISRNTTLRLKAFEVHLNSGNQIDDGEEQEGGDY